MKNPCFGWQARLCGIQRADRNVRKCSLEKTPCFRIFLAVDRERVLLRTKILSKFPDFFGWTSRRLKWKWTMKFKRRVLLWPVSAVSGFALIHIMMGSSRPEMLLPNPRLYVTHAISLLIFTICLLVIVHIFHAENRYNKSLASQRDSQHTRPESTHKHDESKSKQLESDYLKFDPQDLFVILDDYRSHSVKT